MDSHYLATPLRRALEKAIKVARVTAEDGAADALRRLGIGDPKAPPYLTDEERALRRRLRAQARALGDQPDGGASPPRLTEAAAYAHWHRMLFARFLAERGLLRHPKHGVSVTLADCRELAEEEGLGDPWAVAERYAAAMLPAVFRIDDPVLRLLLDAAKVQALHRLVANLDPDVFAAEDSLGWTYQFWRAAEKDAVNKAGGKIGAAELPAVTQLFTEPYMVRFLLHNTVGAWRAGKVLRERPDLAEAAADEAELRAAVSPPGYSFDMLRFVQEGAGAPRWRPAAGTFPGWPATAAMIRALDPCCGSGHFLTEILAILASLRADEEGLEPADAIAGALRDNLFGLEIDGRCVQIAAFAVALTAWRIGGFQNLPAPQIAWVGAPPPLPKAEFVTLANGDTELAAGLAALHDVFAQAPLLGSLIDPTGGDLMSPQRLGRIEPLLDRLVERSRAAEPERAEGAIAARGMADAAAILARSYTLVATNVPFLGRGKQAPALANFIDQSDRESRADLATAMLNRTLRLLEDGGATAAVTPQNWCFLAGSTNYRADLLSRVSLRFFVTLGEEAWEEFGDRGPLATLIGISRKPPAHAEVHFTANALPIRERKRKVDHLLTGSLRLTKQADQISSPDSRIVADEPVGGSLLSAYATAYQGIATGDYDRFGRLFFELPLPLRDWVYQASTVESTRHFGGLEHVLFWEAGKGALASSSQARIQGLSAVGRLGLCVTQMRTLCVSRFIGSRFDNNCAAMVVADESNLPAVWSFCSSPEYQDAIRRVDQKVSVTNATLTKVPFDLAHWSQVAAELYPNGLPKPYSDDPTQWLFHGHPSTAEAGTQLHVALARLAGYRWPAESDPDMCLSPEARAWSARAAALPVADADGVLCLPAVAGARPLADLLREYLNVAIPGWDEARLVREADERFDKKPSRDLSLDSWLRDRAFRQHCALFHNRPFLWQVWDGQHDGFSAFLDYHRLDTGALRRLTYTVLGDWKRRVEAESRLLEAAAILGRKLELILEGEAPHDIFVRWKPLARQPLGWDPDLDDGIRLNIRPWIGSGVLRDPHPKGIKWGIDRGGDIVSAPWFPLDKGKRNNDRHTTLAEKRAARADAVKAAE